MGQGVERINDTASFFNSSSHRCDGPRNTQGVKVRRRLLHQYHIAWDSLKSVIVPEIEFQEKIQAMQDFVVRRETTAANAHHIVVSFPSCEPVPVEEVALKVAAPGDPWMEGKRLLHEASTALAHTGNNQIRQPKIF